MDGEDALTIYTYRDFACLTIRDGQVTARKTYASRKLFEDAVRTAGLGPGESVPAVCVRDGRAYQAAPGGKVRSWPLERPAEVTTVGLSVPHWPPPVPICWTMVMAGLLGTIGLIGTAVKVDDCRRSRP